MLQAELNNLLVKSQAIGPLEILDGLVLLAMMYGFYRVIRRTRAVNLVKGLLILVLFFCLASALKLQMITYILEKSVYFFVVAIAVVFAPELRRALERVGNFHRLSGGDLTDPEIDAVLKAINETVGNLSRRRVGALVVFEQGTGLEEIAETGIPIDGCVSSGLLINIFEKNTPLHDGAVIIRGNRVVAATCYLPLTDQTLTKDLGTRHRAAIGMSEQSDALIVVVSEQTGDISVAREGELMRYLAPGDVEALLVEHLYKKMNRSSMLSIAAKCFK